RGRREEHDEVMPFLRRHFGRGTRGDQSEIDVVDGDVGIVFSSPLLHVLIVEPLVVGRNEVAPLQNFQSLLGGMLRAWCDNGTDGCQYARPGGCLDHVSAGCATTNETRRFHGVSSRIIVSDMSFRRDM